MGIVLKFVGVAVLGSISLGTLAQTQQSAEKQRLTVVCYWQNFQETIFLHLGQPGSGPYHYHDGCDPYMDPTHFKRTVGEMVRDSKHDWERVTAKGFIYTISCRRDCKEFPLEQRSYEVETDGKWMWITFEKPDKKDASKIGSYSVFDGAETHLMSLFQAIRVQRNDAVHPMNAMVSADSVRLSFLAFPHALEKTESLKNWFQTNPKTV
jgi:hypothetical protein